MRAAFLLQVSAEVSATAFGQVFIFRLRKRAAAATTVGNSRNSKPGILAGRQTLWNVANRLAATTKKLMEQNNAIRG